MKTKLFCVIAFTLFVQIVNAQRLGIKGGVNFANMSFSSSGMNFSPKSITGFHFGPVAEFQLQNSLYFNTGLLFSLKGFKFEAQSVSATDKLNYLEIPLNLAYKLSINETSDFLIQAGPYLGYALHGTEKVNGESTNIAFGDGGMKRIDYGIGIGAGVEFSSIVVSVNYEFGLANLNDDSTTEGTVKNKVFQISLAYMFGGKK
jgi:hypothetical protein